MAKKKTDRIDEAYLASLPHGWPTHVHPMSVASVGCAFCRGLGFRKSLTLNAIVCPCAYREIFRICLRRFRHEETNWRPGVCYETGKGAINCTRPSSEFIADFLSLSRKRLPDQCSRDLFERHFIRREYYKRVLSTLQLAYPELSEGHYWHKVYSIEEMVGQRLACVRPYRLYPLDDYFGVNRINLGESAGLYKTTKINIMLWNPERLDLPDRSIPDVKAERLRREAAEDDEIQKLRSVPCAA